MNAKDAYWVLMRNRVAHTEALRLIQASHDNGRPIPMGDVTLWPMHHTSDISDAEWEIRYDNRNHVR